MATHTASHLAVAPNSLELTLSPDDNRVLANLCGPLDENLRQLEIAYDVKIVRRGSRFTIRGAPPDTEAAARALRFFCDRAGSGLTLDEIQLGLVELRGRSSTSHRTPGVDRVDRDRVDRVDRADRVERVDRVDRVDRTGAADDEPILQTRRADLHGRTPRQVEYLRNIQGHDITFGIGPAGTGKTYLAVACAVDALERDAVKRIVLVRPAVEAGEKLGFLPGDLAQKVDPYLRPLYDALYDLTGFDKVIKLNERNAIEVAPLAYMRGRTLNHSFIILDEAQNTTPEQMKMFLTRIGFGTKAVVTGDITQIDLDRRQKSGLIDAQQVLAGVRGIAFTQFTSADVVRHPLVQHIVDAYERQSTARRGEDQP